MTIYTVHAPVAPGDTLPRDADQFVFVRDGFHLWAMLLSLPWLIYHRLWWATLGYLVLSLVLDLTLVSLGVGAGAIMLVMALVALLMGLEGVSLRRWTLSRGKWRQVGIVAAADEDAAERSFFAQWAGRIELETDPASIGRGSAPPPRPPSAPSVQPSSPDHVLGLFPNPGLSR